MLRWDVNVDDRARFELEKIQSPIVESWLRNSTRLPESEQANALLRVYVHAWQNLRKN